MCVCVCVCVCVYGCVCVCSYVCIQACVCHALSRNTKQTKYTYQTFFAGSGFGSGFFGSSLAAAGRLSGTRSTKLEGNLPFLAPHDPSNHSSFTLAATTIFAPVYTTTKIQVYSMYSIVHMKTKHLPFCSLQNVENHCNPQVYVHIEEYMYITYKSKDVHTPT